MFYSAFDEFLPEDLQEKNKADSGLLPSSLQPEIETFNEWTYDILNNGVYKAGFAGTQAAYDEHVIRVFEGLDRLEKHLANNASQNKGPYMFGKHITEADIRMYPTIVRFDMAYYTIFKCNLGMIRIDYPHIHKWLRILYWGDESGETRGAFRSTTYPEHVSLETRVHCMRLTATIDQGGLYRRGEDECCAERSSTTCHATRCVS